MSEDKKQKVVWRPSSLLPNPVKDLNLSSSFAYRWEISNDVAITRAKSEQWEIVTPNVKVRELILMRMPKDVANARNAYFAEKNRIQNVGATQLKNGASSLAKHQYGGMISDTDESVLDERIV